MSFSIFFQMAKKHHPDTNPDDPDSKAKFAKLAEAYEVPNTFFSHLKKFRISDSGWVFTFAFPTEKVLSDEVKRKQYDLGFHPSRGSTGQQQQHYRAGASSLDPEELFRRIFGEFADFGHFNSVFDDRPEVGYDASKTQF